MKNKIIWLGLSVLLVASMLLASCGTKSTTTPTTSTSTTVTSTTTSTETITATTTESTTAVTTTATSTGNWWDSWGTPTYGGTIITSTTGDIVNFDPYNGTANASQCFAWMEPLFQDNWLLPPSNYQNTFRTPDVVAGCIAQSWSMPDSSTVIVKIRQGIHWQNISPVNGREFTSADVVYHFDRMLGLGDGFTKVDPYWATNTWVSCTSVTANDKYTVTFKWNLTNPEMVLEDMTYASIACDFEASEAVAQWGNLTDWHHAMGTGPFILQDFVQTSSMTLVKNPTYWGTDEHYPQNQIPYVDSMKILIIANRDTSLAALRTGKIDVVGGPTIQQVLAMNKTNPVIKVMNIPGNCYDLDPRDDLAPFNDIRVRIAMQEAINLPLITTSYFQGYADPRPQTELSYLVPGWGFPYDQWPQDLKDEYAFNPTNAKALLAAAGYPKINTTLVYTSTLDGDLMQICVSELADVGINVTLQPMDSSAINAYLLTAHANTGLASRGSQLGRVMPPTRPLTQFQTGDSVNYVMWSDPVYDAFYPAAMAATTIDATKAVVKAANEYVARKHIEICTPTANSFTFYQPWLMGYTNGTGGNGMEYGARLWVNQDLKKSMGH